MPNSLTELSFPRLESVSNNAFAGLGRLRKIDLPQVTEIGEKAFYSCVSLTDVNCPNVKKLGASVFIECYALRNIDCSHVTSFGSENIFFHCYGLKHLVFSDMTEIDTSGCFYGCANLLLEFPNAQRIRFEFLRGSVSLTVRLTTPNRITVISDSSGVTYSLDSHTLYLHENKKTEVSGSTWKGYTWKQIFFVDDNGNVVP